MAQKMISTDGNGACAYVAHNINEVIAIYPITPSSGLGEIADERSAAGLTNIWGTIPAVVEMQSEAGAAGTVHGALTTGALTCTFTASQGLLLMIPNMYKIAGELLPTVFHVTARSLACQALSIFGDHSDVMAVRSTGWGMIASGSVQEVMDMTLISQAVSLESRIPFVHFYEGFRISHEIQKIEELTTDDMKAMIDDKYILEHRARGMSPDHPVIRGTAQNPDVYFQGRETVNKYYLTAPAIVQKAMDKFAGIVGRQYHLFDYVGAPDAEKVIVVMGAAAETTHDTVNYLNERGEKLGLVKVRLYRPFSVDDFVNALPGTVRSISVLDRTKEPGAVGEPLYIDVHAAIAEAMARAIAPFSDYPLIVGGRFGLGSKDFTPAMAKAVFDNLSASEPKNHFTVGIVDDVTNSSLDVGPAFTTESDKVFRGMFYGLGADGTVGANKNSIKIIGDNTDNYAQGFFVYDSRKAGSITTSHLRFGPDVIRNPYLIERSNFVACHNFAFLERYDMLSSIEEGGTFLLNSPYDKDEVWNKIPIEVQQQIIEKKLNFFVIDGIKLGHEIGLGPRINIIMQTAFFIISGIIPQEQAAEEIKKSVKKTYGKKGEKVVEMNYQAVDKAIQSIQQVDYPNEATSKIQKPPVVPDDAPEFVKKLTAELIANRGDQVPVSLMPDDGTFPSATTQYEKRNIATQIPEWDPDTCIQCAQCSLVCPHAAIRVKAYDPPVLDNASETFKSADARGPSFKGMKFTVQVAPEDCTGCGVCVQNCPAVQKDSEGNKTDRHAINMVTQFDLRDQEAENFAFFLDIPETDPSLYKKETIKGSQLIRPLFEFSGACAGCGETPYVKLLTQLFGDRAVIANATGCSSIYGGNLPTTPYAKRGDGRGPAWSNSLFEDTAEFCFGYRLTFNKFNEFARELAVKLSGNGLSAHKNLLDSILNAEQKNQDQIEQQRALVEELKNILDGRSDEDSIQLHSVADYLVKKSVWAIGGDGWAYDIGYGGLDHIIALDRDVNILVLDTEVYSNTGGQMSKSTPLGATARFAAAGKSMPKKDLGLMAMTYGTAYVAKVAIGANPAQTVRAFMEAEAYDGPSLIIAYSHCIAHGINMTKGLEEQKNAVKSGHWPLYRFNPDLLAEGKNPLILESKKPSIDLAEYIYSENRYRVLQKTHPERAAALLKQAQKDVKFRYNIYKKLAELDFNS